MIAAAALVIVPWVVCGAALRRLIHIRWPTPLLAALSLGLSIGLASVFWWLLLQVPFTSARAFIAADLALWTAAMVALLAARRRPPREAPQVASAAPQAPAAPLVPGAARWLVFLLFLGTAAIAVVSSSALTAVQPHGSWDAWAIWNLRARFLFDGWPHQWQDGFSASLAWSHPDYPLLVPVTVARLWLATGRDWPSVPIAVSWLFSALTVGVLGTTIARHQGRTLAFAAAAALLASPTFVTESASQIADMPLAFFMLATFVSLSLADEGGAGAYVAAGAFAGLAAWTKNEGTVFAAIVLVVAGTAAIRAHGWRGLAAAGLLCAGAVPALAALTVFRITVSPPSELVAAATAARLAARLTNVPRMRTIAVGLGRALWLNGAALVGPLPIVAASTALRGFTRHRHTAARLALVAMVLMIGAYAATYAISPYNLEWHIGTSVDRLVLQVLPTSLWTLTEVRRK